MRHSRKKRDELLELIHNEWHSCIHESGRTFNLASVYGFSPFSISSSITGGIPEEGEILSGRLKNGIPEEQYYTLLEWKDGHLNEFVSKHGARPLNDLTPKELADLYQSITHKDDLPF